MGDHGDPPQAEQDRASGGVGIELARRPASAGRSSRPPSPARGPERAALRTAAGDRARRPLHRLQRDVAGEAVGDDHVRRAAGSMSRPSTLPAKSIPSPAARRLARLDDERVALASAPRPRSAGRFAGARRRARQSRTPTRGRRTGRDGRDAPRRWLRRRAAARGASRPGTGTWTASAGRWTPCSRLSANSAAVIAAPVDPALTSACERPSPTSAAASTIEAPGLRAHGARPARPSSRSHSAAATTSIPVGAHRVEPARPAAPKTRTAIPSAAAARAPAAITLGPAVGAEAVERYGHGPGSGAIYSSEAGAPARPRPGSPARSPRGRRRSRRPGTPGAAGAGCGTVGTR